MKLSRMQIIPVIALIVSFGFLILLLPGWNMIGNVKSQIDEDRLTLNELEQLTERSSDLANRTTELRAQLDRVNEKFLTPTSALEFITSLEAAAAKQGVALDLQKFDPPQTKASTSTLQLSASGPLDSLLDFMHDIESLTWLVTIDSTSFSLATTTDRSLNGETTSNQIVLSLTGKTYWLPNTIK